MTFEQLKWTTLSLIWEKSLVLALMDNLKSMHFEHPQNPYRSHVLEFFLKPHVRIMIDYHGRWVTKMNIYPITQNWKKCEFSMGIYWDIIKDNEGKNTLSISTFSMCCEH